MKKKAMLLFGTILISAMGFSQDQTSEKKELVVVHEKQYLKDGKYKAKISKKGTPAADGSTPPGFDDAVEIEVRDGLVIWVDNGRFFRNGDNSKLINSVFRWNDKGFYVAETTVFEQNPKNQTDKGNWFTYKLMVSP